MPQVSNSDGHFLFAVENAGWKISEPNTRIWQIRVEATGYTTGQHNATKANFTRDEMIQIHDAIAEAIGIDS